MDLGERFLKKSRVIYQSRGRAVGCFQVMGFPVLERSRRCSNSPYRLIMKYSI